MGLRRSAACRRSISGGTGGWRPGPVARAGADADEVSDADSDGDAIRASAGLGMRTESANDSSSGGSRRAGVDPAVVAVGLAAAVAATPLAFADAGSWAVRGDEAGAAAGL